MFASSGIVRRLWWVKRWSNFTNNKWNEGFYEWVLLQSGFEEVYSRSRCWRSLIQLKRHLEKFEGVDNPTLVEHAKLSVLQPAILKSSLKLWGKSSTFNLPLFNPNQNFFSCKKQPSNNVNSITQTQRNFCCKLSHCKSLFNYTYVK